MKLLELIDILNRYSPNANVSVLITTQDAEDIYAIDTPERIIDIDGADIRDNNVFYL